MLQRIKDYIIAFLIGALVVALGVTSYLLKNAKPVINTDSYVESLEQSIKKLKQSGQNNTQDVKGEIDMSSTPVKKKRFLGIFKRKIKQDDSNSN